MQQEDLAAVVEPADDQGCYLLFMISELARQLSYMCS